MEEKKKRILIAGGAGFIGSHLCQRLVTDKNNIVVCLDNLFTGHRETISKLEGLDNFKFIEFDVENPISEYSDGFDEIYNLACPASPMHYQCDPVKTIRTAVLGTINLLDIARKSGARILQASTSEVYGNPNVHPQTESYYGNVNPVGIRSCYDEGKRCAETLMMDYFRQYGVRTKIVRIFNTYGPNMSRDDGRVISNFIVQALRGEPITIYGDGNQTRSFQYVSDLIDGLIAMMDSDDSFCGPVNIGNPEEYTIGELASKVVTMTNSQSIIVSRPLPLDDPRQRRPSVTLAKAVLGWEPKINLDEGLRQTIEYFKSVI